MAVKFGFKAKAISKPSARAPPSKGRLAFGGGDEGSDEDRKNNDENEEAIDNLVLASSRTKTSPKDAVKADSKLTSKLKLEASRFDNSSSRLTAAKHAEEALALDSTIYDYDAAYDAIHARDAAQKAAAKAAAAEGKSRYMDGLLASAEVRKRDQLQAREKVLQREREAEGEDFADKEKFVTGAYKAQQEEVKRLEEEEKRREEEEEKKRKTMGMTGFYKHVMQEQEKRYQEITQAAAEAEKNGLPSMDDEPKQKSAADQAREVNAQGGNVAVNEDGQVVDRRELLTAGLNVVAKPKQPGANATTSRAAAAQTPWQGKSSGQKAMRERQTKMIEEQLEQAAKRAADDEAEQQRQLEHKAKSQKTETDISSAKERYLQRKREAAAAAAAKK